MPHVAYGAAGWFVRRGAIPRWGFQLVVDLPVHPGGLLPEGDLPTPGAEPPVVLDAEVLTLPRLLGTGCLALLLAIPFAVALAGLVISVAVR
jgi:hypothetical protein